MTTTGPRYWHDRHVVVTGGSSGIGHAVVRQALAAGARVTALARESERLQRLRGWPEAHGGDRLAVVAADVSAKEELAAALEAGRVRHGPVGALVTSAGVGGAGNFREFDDEEFEKHIRVNYLGTLYAIRGCLDDLESTRGSVTCIASVAGFLGVWGYSAYAPSKFAVRGLCEVLRAELRPRGVTVTAVYPPDVDTPMLAYEQPLKPPQLRALSDGGHALSADDVARALMRATVRGRASTYPGASTVALRVVSGVAPNLTARIMDRVTDRAGARA